MRKEYAQWLVSEIGSLQRQPRMQTLCNELLLRRSIRKREGAHARTEDYLCILGSTPSLKLT
jgi:hypothetical protein